MGNIFRVMDGPWLPLDFNSCKTHLKGVSKGVLSLKLCQD